MLKTYCHYAIKLVNSEKRGWAPIQSCKARYYRKKVKMYRPLWSFVAEHKEEQETGKYVENEQLLLVFEMITERNGYGEAFNAIVADYPTEDCRRIESNIFFGREIVLWT